VSRPFSTFFILSSQALLGILAVVAIVFRFLYLETTPPGFFLDEAAAGANLICLAKEGITPAGAPVGIFSVALGGGYFTPLYLRFGAAWVSLFGESIASIRAISAFVTVLTIFGVVVLARILFNPVSGWFAGLLATLSPWSFQFSRLAWDPPFMPCCLVWGLVLILSKRQGVLRSVGGGLLLSAAMYSYPPARVQVPILCVVVQIYLAYRKQWRLRAFLQSSGALIVSALPLGYLTVTGAIQGRYQMLSVFGDYYAGRIGHPVKLFEGLQIIVANFAKHLTPNFLFIRGDANLRHSSQFVGELGWVEAFAALVAVGLFVYWLVRFRSRLVTNTRWLPEILLVLIAIGTAILPAALTWESVPHALRALATWPFFALLLGFCLSAAARFTRWVTCAAALVAVCYVTYFWPRYLNEYPKFSRGWFDQDLKERAEVAKQTGNWTEFVQRSRAIDPVVVRYYLMAYAGQGCLESRDRHAPRGS
jgi:4-amino-4-deoxy-L-arabinose transferase-like glycosyltransferase